MVKIICGRNHSNGIYTGVDEIRDQVLEWGYGLTLSLVTLAHVC